MRLEVYEDELNVYLCVFDKRGGCVGIARVSKESPKARERFAELLEQLNEDPEGYVVRVYWRDFELPGLVYERKILRSCLLCCWLSEDGSVNHNNNMSPIARNIIGGAYSDFYAGEDEPECEDCRVSGLISED